MDGDCAAFVAAGVTAVAANDSMVDGSVFLRNGRDQSAHGACLFGLAVDGEAVARLQLDTPVDGEGAAVRQDQVNIADDSDPLVDGDITLGHMPAVVPLDGVAGNGGVGIDGFGLFCHGAAVPAPLDVRHTAIPIRPGRARQQAQAERQAEQRGKQSLFHIYAPFRRGEEVPDFTPVRPWRVPKANKYIFIISEMPRKVYDLFYPLKWVMPAGWPAGSFLSQHILLQVLPVLHLQLFHGL